MRIAPTVLSVSLALAACASRMEHVDPVTGPVATISIMDYTVTDSRNTAVIKYMYNDCGFLGSNDCYQSDIYYGSSKRQPVSLRKVPAPGKQARIYVTLTQRNKTCSTFFRFTPVDQGQYQITMATDVPDTSFLGGTACLVRLVDVTDPSKPIVIKRAG